MIPKVAVSATLDHTLTGQRGSVNSVSFSPGGKRIAVSEVGQGLEHRIGLRQDRLWRRLTDLEP